MAPLLGVLRYRKAPDEQEKEQVLEALLKDPWVRGVLKGVARKYRWAWDDPGTLERWAQEGFREALEGYDPWRGFPDRRRLCFKESADPAIIGDLNGGEVPRDWLKANGYALSGEACVEVRERNLRWELWDEVVVYLVAVLGMEMGVYEGASFWNHVRWKARDRIRQEIGRQKKDPEEALSEWLRQKGLPADYQDALADPDRRDALEEALRDRAGECLRRHILPWLQDKDPNLYFLVRKGEFGSSREMFEALYPDRGKEVIRRMDAAFRQWESRTFRPYREGHWLWRSLEPGVQAQLRQDWEAFLRGRRVSWQGLVEWARKQKVLRDRDAGAVAGAMAHGLGRTETCSVCWVEERLRACGCGFTLEALGELFLTR